VGGRCRRHRQPRAVPRLASRSSRRAKVEPRDASRSWVDESNLHGRVDTRSRSASRQQLLASLGEFAYLRLQILFTELIDFFLGVPGQPAGHKPLVGASVAIGRHKVDPSPQALDLTLQILGIVVWIPTGASDSVASLSGGSAAGLHLVRKLAVALPRLLIDRRGRGSSGA
jgi:hypothetical protein